MRLHLQFAFSEAHEYYLKYDVNPTLVRILSEMSKIYMTSYLDCENEVISELNCVRDLMENGTKSTSIECTDLNSVLPPSTYESIASLLGGALKALLDCRFAMTDAVVSKYADEMGPLALEVIEHLSKLLLKLRRVIVSLPQPPKITSEVARSSEKEETLSVIKDVYTQLLAFTTCSDGKSTINPTDSCQSLYNMLDKLNSQNFLKSFLMIN